MRVTTFGVMRFDLSRSQLGPSTAFTCSAKRCCTQRVFTRGAFARASYHVLLRRNNESMFSQLDLFSMRVFGWNEILNECTIHDLGSIGARPPYIYNRLHVPRTVPEPRVVELFVTGRICLFGEHSDWAGGNSVAACAVDPVLDAPDQPTNPRVYSMWLCALAQPKRSHDIHRENMWLWVLPPPLFDDFDSFFHFV